MQAIITRFLAPTNFRGARIKAIAEAGYAILSWDHAFSPEVNHCNAAKELCARFGWNGTYYSGGIHGTGDMVWVCVHPNMTPREGKEKFTII